MAFEADYQVVLLDTNGNTLDILDTRRIQKLDYERIVNDFGTMSFTIPATDRAAQHKTKLDMMMEVYRRNVSAGPFVKEETYLLRFYNQFEDSNGIEWVIFAGFSLNHLLLRRVIIVADDPNGADGFSSKLDDASIIMKEFVDEQAINPNVNTFRAITGLTIPSQTEVGASVFQRVPDGKNLLEILQGIVNADTDRIADFTVVRTTGRALNFLVARIGTDRTKTTNPAGPFTLYDPRRGNITQPSLTVDRKSEKTVAFVMGTGAEDLRLIFPVTGNFVGSSIWNRIETVVNGNFNDDDADGLIDTGRNKLENNSQKINFIFQPDKTRPQAQYNVDWFLGDRVTAQYSGFEQDLRIKRIFVSLTERETIETDMEIIESTS